MEFIIYAIVFLVMVSIFFYYFLDSDDNDNDEDDDSFDIFDPSKPEYWTLGPGSEDD